MFRKLGFLFVICLAFTDVCLAQKNIIQSLERIVPGQGKVTIHQDPRIGMLVGADSIPMGEDGKRVIKRNGYRIQIYAGNNTRQAKNEAYSIASHVKELFPDLSVYTSFYPPRWLCRAGDFRSIEEADAMMRQLRASGEFKEVSIVREQINIPLE